MNRTALVLAAHGSHSDPAVRYMLQDYADRLREFRLFDAIGLAFHQGDPPFSEALDRLEADNFVVVPVMTSAGYYAETVLPRELRKNRCYDDAHVIQTAAVGTHPRMVDLIADRVRFLVHEILVHDILVPEIEGQPERLRYGSRGQAQRRPRKSPASPDFDPERVGFDGLRSPEGRPFQGRLDSGPILPGAASAAADLPPATIDQPCGLLATSLIVVGHGTRRNPQSRETTQKLVKALRELRVCSEVLAAFLDDEPGVEEAFAVVSNPAVIVVPFLIASGPHATKDLPRRLGLPYFEAGQPPYSIRLGERSMILDRAVGTDPRIVEVIADLGLQARARISEPRTSVRAVSACSETFAQASAHEAPTSSKTFVPTSVCAVPTSSTTSARTEVRGSLGFVRSVPPDLPVHTGVLRLGTRGSALAKWQSDHVAQRLRAVGVDVEIVTLSTTGDRTLGVPIADLDSDAPFTDDIDAALLAGEIDFAVHSLKDLPVDLPSGIAVAAVLPRGDAGESLVSRDRVLLSELPHGALIGTSSPRRRAQLLAIRRDLCPVPIRGPVDDRIRQVQRGDFAAAVLATAGLERLGCLDTITETFPLEQFVPAPGQGALAITVRAQDEMIMQLLAPLDDGPTRRATRAELELLRPFERSKEWALAAYATVDMRNDRIQLRGRLLSADGGKVYDVAVRAFQPEAAASHALRSLRAFQSGIAP